jgi:hypothetical protein
MSYIITSNIDVNHQNKFGTIATQGLNKAYSYTNAMDNVVIPENSEIAVSSVKVTREGQFTISQDNNRFALYHGAEQDPDGLPSSTLGYMEELSQPVLGTIRGESGGMNSVFSVDDFAKAVQESFRLFTFHPSYQKSDLNPSGVMVSASRVVNEGFKGFSYSFNQYSGSAVVNNASFLAEGPLIAPKRPSMAAPPATANPIPSPLTVTANGSTVEIVNGSALANERVEGTAYSTILGNRPLSLIGQAATSGGQCLFNIKDYRAGAEGNTAPELYNFEVGLTRSQKNYRVYDDANSGDEWFAPAHFVDTDPDEDIGYYDWLVRGVPITNASGNLETELRIYHAVNEGGVAGNMDTALSVLKEVDYVSNLGGAGSKTKFRLLNASFSATGKEIEKVRFIANGEQMNIAFVDSDGVSTGMEITSIDYTNSTNKAERLKPINSMCWSLYPKVLVRGYGDTGAAKNKITIEEYNGVLPTDHQYGGLKKTQRPSYREATNDGIYDMMNDLYQFCKTQSGKYYDQIKLSDCITEAINYFQAETNTTVPTQRIAAALTGVTGGQKYLNISNVLMMGTDLNYFQDIARLNCKRILGFPNQSKIVGAYGPVGWDGQGTAPQVRTSADNLLQSAYDSDTQPKIISGESSFVRLRNVATQSYNVANRSFSKILYHIPKFDSSGEEVGALFFEPNTPIYIKLNNSTPLNLNSFDVDLVTAREIILPSYTGTTVVCFHIRKSQQ